MHSPNFLNIETVLSQNSTYTKIVHVSILINADILAKNIFSLLFKFLKFIQMRKKNLVDMAYLGKISVKIIKFTFFSFCRKE